jgi:hypothetical protein
MILALKKGKVDGDHRRYLDFSKSLKRECNTPLSRRSCNLFSLLSWNKKASPTGLTVVQVRAIQEACLLGDAHKAASRKWN